MASDGPPRLSGWPVNYMQLTLTWALFSAPRSWPRTNSATGESGVLGHLSGGNVAVGPWDPSFYPFLSFFLSVKAVGNDVGYLRTFPAVPPRGQPGLRLPRAVEAGGPGVNPGSALVRRAAWVGAQVPRGLGPFVCTMGGPAPHLRAWSLPLGVQTEPLRV